MPGPTRRFWNDEDQRSTRYDGISEVRRAARVTSYSQRETKHTSLGTASRIEATTDTGYHVIATHYSGDPEVVQVFIYSPDHQSLIVCDNNVPTRELDAFIQQHTKE